VGCGVLYHPKEARRSNKYCSRPCAIIHRKIHPKGFTNSGSFKPGVPSWNNGVDGYLAGHEVSEETKEKIRLANSGSNAPNWKGGISKAVDCLRHSGRGLDWRKSVFERDNYTCRNCGDRSRAGHRIIINAHHVKLVSEYPDLIFEVTNGVTLCKSCHLKEHGRKAELMQ
jgi:hypothetical protein